MKAISPWEWLQEGGREEGRGHCCLQQLKGCFLEEEVDLYHMAPRGKVTWGADFSPR